VQQDEQRAALSVARWDEHGLLQRTTHESALDREVLVRAGSATGAGDEDEGESREASHRKRRDSLRSFSTRPPVWHSGQ
jgi:hypothetical protein